MIEPGDVVVRRERVPSLNPKPLAAPPWRFRVRIAPATTEGQVFNSFQHAASAGEQLAAQCRTRLLYLEEDVPRSSLITDPDVPARGGKNASVFADRRSMNPGHRHHFINHSAQITVETAVLVLQLRRLADADRMIAARYLEALRQCRELLRRLISLTRP